MAKVVLNDVKKIYDENVVAVKGVSVEINDKEFVVLVGPSGCGKSTTLRMVAGLEDISSGTLTIDGKLMNDVAPKDRDIAMVFQNYALYPHMSVFENMAFGLKLRKFSKEEIKKRVDEAAKILDIENYLDRKPKALSGGQRQRVAVGRAIVRKPKVFLFDEPLSNLDAKMRIQMRTEISKLHKRLGATMMYVTHDQTEAMTMGDRIVVMKDGNVMQIDTPLNLYNNPANKFVAGFIGSPAMNFIHGTITTNGTMKFKENGSLFAVDIPKNKHKTLKPYSNKEVWLGIRPEHIELSRSSKSGVKGNVEIVEPVGNEIFVYFSTGVSQNVARMAPVAVKTGGQINFVIDTAHVHFFDNGTENVIQ